jgi:flagellar protein FlgJ
MTVTDFIKRTYNAAMAVQAKYNVNALVAMAQSAQETGWGASTPGNMFFGIKAGTGWTGKKQLLWTHEYINGVYTKVQAWFRAYDSVEESFEDWAHFLSSNSRYANALNYPDNPNQFITEIAKAGYATDPNYASSIIAKIDTIKKKLKTSASQLPSASVPAPLSSLGDLSIGLPDEIKPVDYSQVFINLKK